MDDTVNGKRTTYELTRGPVTLATGGKTVDGVDLIAKGISLTVTGSNGSFYVTVDGKDAELTVNDGNTELAIVTAISEPHTHVDDIIERTGLPATQVLGELTLLQIKGFVTQEPGKRFSLNISTSQK